MLALVLNLVHFLIIVNLNLIKLKVVTHLFSKRGLLNKTTELQSIETIRGQVDRLRIMEEKKKSVPEEYEINEEDFEEVIGSGLTSETEEKVKTPRDSKPKTIPGRRLQVKDDKKQEKASVSKKIKTRKKTGKNSNICL